MEAKMIENELLQVAEIELLYKTKVKASEMPKIICSKVLRNSWDENKIEFIEQFKILLLNRGKRVLCCYEISTGGMTGTVADIRLIFVTVLKTDAVAIMLCHKMKNGRC